MFATKRIKSSGILILTAALMIVGGLTGCSAASMAQVESTDEAPKLPEVVNNTVVAEAAIEPARWSEMTFETSGVVAEVLVNEGDFVQKGSPVIRLDGARLQLDLDEAKTSLETAELRLAEAKSEHTRQLAEAQLQVQVAEGRIAQAQTRYPSLTGVQIALAQATRVESDAAYEYEKAVNRPWEWKHEEIQKAYTDEWQRAKDNLAVAQADYDALIAEQYAHSHELDILQAELERARLDLERLEQGIDPMLAQEVKSTRVRVDRTQVELDDTVIVAPFTGTVTNLSVDLGDTVTSGQSMLTLATLDRLQALTIDLTELDIAKVFVGQAVAVTVDALPDVQIEGLVANIDLQAMDFRGDVTYPVTVELRESTPELRWGMTALIEFGID